jgi:hypothetical protein
MARAYCELSKQCKRDGRYSAAMFSRDPELGIYGIGDKVAGAYLCSLRYPEGHVLFRSFPCAQVFCASGPRRWRSIARAANFSGRRGAVQGDAARLRWRPRQQCWHCAGLPSRFVGTLEQNCARLSTCAMRVMSSYDCRCQLRRSRRARAMQFEPARTAARRGACGLRAALPSDARCACSSHCNANHDRQRSTPPTEVEDVRPPRARCRALPPCALATSFSRVSQRALAHVPTGFQMGC